MTVPQQFAPFTTFEIQPANSAFIAAAKTYITRPVCIAGFIPPAPTLENL